MDTEKEIERPVVEVLRQARALIAAPGHWTRDAEARDARGRATGVDDPRAVRWCALGALKKAWVSGSNSRFAPVRLSLEAYMGDDIADFNDSHKHAAVLAAFDKAIAELEATA